MMKRLLSVIVFSITLGYVVQAGVADEQLHPSGSTAGAGIINSTTDPSIPKLNKTAKLNLVEEGVKKNVVIDPKDLIDPKASEQVLQLIVKIAEHPATWKQIHRVLETLEANNVAYSRRIDGVAGGMKTADELGWMNKRVDRPGDKRNDVPEEPEAPIAAYGSTTTAPISDNAFRQWKEALFAHQIPVEDPPTHPQLFQSPVYEEPTVNPSLSPAVKPTSSVESKKSFEERLKDIEDELKKLSKLAIRSAMLKPGRRINTPILPAPPSANQTAKPLHPKFQYHKVQGNSTEANNMVGSNYWKRVASLKRAELQPGGTGKGSVGRRNTFVAVSVASNSKVEAEPMMSTEPYSPPLKSCIKKKNRHSLWKQKQRQKAQKDADDSL